MNITEKCHRSAFVLNSIARKIPFENLRSSVIALTQCTGNVHTVSSFDIKSFLQRMFQAIAEISQQRTAALDDYDNDEDLSDQNLLFDLIQQTRSLLRSIVTNHLNLGQSFRITKPEIIMFFEKISSVDQQYQNEYVTLPLNFIHSNETFLVQVCSSLWLLLILFKFLFQTITDQLTRRGNSISATDSSGSVSLSVFDENEKELFIKNHRIEIFIPRRPDAPIPPMLFQNVTYSNQSSFSKRINLKEIQSNEKAAFSLQLQILPLKENISYLFYYQFDQTKDLTYSIDRLVLFCSSSKTSICQIQTKLIFSHLDFTRENPYTFFLDNEQISNHHSLMFTLQEQNSNNCSQNSIVTRHFTSDFDLRIYASSCSYLGQHYGWQSNGLIVSSNWLFI